MLFKNIFNSLFVFCFPRDPKVFCFFILAKIDIPIQFLKKGKSTVNYTKSYKTAETFKYTHNIPAIIRNCKKIQQYPNDLNVFYVTISKTFYTLILM